MTPSDSTTTPVRPCVLLVDDIPANIGVVVDMLSCESIEVLIATGGEEALELIANHPPDLVLRDVRLPGHRRL